MRITQRDLEIVCNRINKVTDMPETYATKNPDGTYTTNIGNYHLDYANGRVSLEQTENERGGVRRVCGGGTKRELYDQMQAFLAGAEAAKNI